MHPMERVRMKRDQVPSKNVAGEPSDHPRPSSSAPMCALLPTTVLPSLTAIMASAIRFGDAKSSLQANIINGSVNAEFHHHLPPGKLQGLWSRSALLLTAGRPRTTRNSTEPVSHHSLRSRFRLCRARGDTRPDRPKMCRAGFSDRARRPRWCRVGT